MAHSPDGCWHAYKNRIRTGTLTTGTAAAFGCALAPCDGSDLLTLRLHSTCSWVISIGETAPSSEGWRVVAIPRRSTPLHALCAPSRTSQPGLLEDFTPPEHAAAYWSCSSSRNPLGNCIGAGSETDPGPDSARTRFLLRAWPHSSLVAKLDRLRHRPEELVRHA
jgi:hypothetical protein